MGAVADREASRRGAAGWTRRKSRSIRNPLLPLTGVSPAGAAARKAQAAAIAWRSFGDGTARPATPAKPESSLSQVPLSTSGLGEVGCGNVTASSNCGWDANVDILKQ